MSRSLKILKRSIRGIKIAIPQKTYTRTVTYYNDKYISPTNPKGEFIRTITSDSPTSITPNTTITQTVLGQTSEGSYNGAIPVPESAVQPVQVQEEEVNPSSTNPRDNVSPPPLTIKDISISPYYSGNQQQFRAPSRETSPNESSVPESAQPNYLTQGTYFKDQTTQTQNIIPQPQQAPTNRIDVPSRDRFLSPEGKTQTYKDVAGVKTKADLILAESQVNYDTKQDLSAGSKLFALNVGVGAVNQVMDFGIVDPNTGKLKAPLSNTMEGSLQTLTDPVGAVKQFQTNPIVNSGQLTGSILVLEGATLLIKNVATKQVPNQVIDRLNDPNKVYDAYYKVDQTTTTKTITRDLTVKNAQGSITTKTKTPGFVKTTTAPGKIKAQTFIRRGSDYIEVVNIEGGQISGTLKQTVGSKNYFARYTIKGENTQINFFKENKFIKQINTKTPASLNFLDRSRSQTVAKADLVNADTLKAKSQRTVITKEGVSYIVEDQPQIKGGGSKPVTVSKAKIQTQATTNQITYLDQATGKDTGTLKTQAKFKYNANTGKVGLTDIKTKEIPNQIVEAKKTKLPADVVDTSNGLKTTKNPTVKTDTVTTLQKGRVEINTEPFKGGVKNKPLEVTKKVESGVRKDINKEIIKRASTESPQALLTVSKNVVVQEVTPTQTNLNSVTRQLKTPPSFGLKGSKTTTPLIITPLRPREETKTNPPKQEIKFEIKQKTKTNQAIKPETKPAQKITSIVENRIINQVKQEVKQRQEQRIQQITNQEIQQITQPAPRTPTPTRTTTGRASFIRTPTPRIPKAMIFPGKSQAKNSNNFSFSVKKKGSFQSTPLRFDTKQEAFSRGSFIVKNTASASFKVLEGSNPISSKEFNLGSEFRSSRKDQNVIVQKKEFRISTEGEKSEITRRSRLFKKNRARF